MKNNLEIEYKLLVNSKQFEKLCACYPQAVFIRQMNIYYDTANHDLKSAKCAMRIRDKNGEHLFTFKAPGERNGKLEFEKNLNENSIDALKDSEIQTLLSKYISNFDIIEIGRLVTYRAVIEIDHAELCLDVNLYNDKIDFEIEYEWKDEHDGLTCFNKILSQIGLSYIKNCKSKIARCLEL